MKRIVRLTEADLNRLVKRILKEQEFYDEDDIRSSEESPRLKFKKNPRPPFAKNPAKDTWYDADDYEVDEPTDFEEEGYFGLGEFSKFKKFIKNCDTNWCLNVKKWFDANAKYGDIVVRK